MSLFHKPDRSLILEYENNDLRNLNLKRIVDDDLGYDPSNIPVHVDYEYLVYHYVLDGIKYRALAKSHLESAYSTYQPNSCDISCYKDFVDMQKIMLDNPDRYRQKSVCIEGYVHRYYPPVNNRGRLRDNADVMLAPFPTNTDIGWPIFCLCSDQLNLTEMIYAVSDSELPHEVGQHVRFLGHPCYYNVDGKPGSIVKLLVTDYEILI